MSAPAPRFRRWIGIDYSGAATADTRLPGLRAAMVDEAGGTPQPIAPPSASGSGRPRNWTRRELAAWLIDRLGEDVPTAVGIDHAFGHPRPAKGEERPEAEDWDAWLSATAAAWPADRPDVTVAALRRAGAPVGDRRRLRHTDAWTAGAKPVFLFDVQGSVATSTHAGLVWLHQLRRTLPADRVHMWPFDGFRPPPGRHLVAEVFPSLLRRRWPRATTSVDAHDAWCVAAWLAGEDARGALDHHLAPPLPEAVARDARLEGWILGVH